MPSLDEVMGVGDLFVYYSNMIDEECLTGLVWFVKYDIGSDRTIAITLFLIVMNPVLISKVPHQFGHHQAKYILYLSIFINISTSLRGGEDGAKVSKILMLSFCALPTTKPTSK